MDMFAMMNSHAMGGAVAVMAVVSLIGQILSAVASWKVFAKAGVPGWNALVPFFNDYIRFQLFWDKKFFWIFLPLLLVAKAVGADAAGMMAAVFAAASLGQFVLKFFLSQKTARCFGKGTGMGILLCVIPWLGEMILGFGNAEYQAIEK